MKPYKAQYSDNCIIFWPTYEAGKIALIYLSVLGTLFIVTSLWILSDDVTTGTRVAVIVSIPVVLVALYVSCRFVFRKMNIKFIISNIGIVCVNNYIAQKKQIGWEDVSAVYFIEENWYGRKSCRIYLKKETPQVPQKNKSCDFLLPIYDVDEQKLLQFIPTHLWKNNPWYS